MICKCEREMELFNEEIDNEENEIEEYRCVCGYIAQITRCLCCGHSEVLWEK